MRGKKSHAGAVTFLHASCSCPSRRANARFALGLSFRISAPTKRRVGTGNPSTCMVATYLFACRPSFLDGGRSMQDTSPGIISRSFFFFFFFLFAWEDHAPCTTVGHEATVHRTRRRVTYGAQSNCSSSSDRGQSSHI